MAKSLLTDLSVEEIEDITVGLGEPKFRAKQLWQWLVKGAEFSQMSNLPKGFLDKLSQEYTANINPK